MSNLNWGMITCGETFEALVTSLVYFEDPKARLFGRRGKDGGQDALSGDGTLVYQAKFHEQPTMGKVLADIRREAKKIQDYRQPGHQQYDQWKVVTSWRLVTNYTFNGHGDHEQWADEVVPLFQKMGIEADF
ncbi:MAG TPA: hypothetical protein PLA94_20655, partial [Myxococcota bacterium]|nr:hypothetical protein [Myxococcota bacterium]